MDVQKPDIRTPFCCRVAAVAATPMVTGMAPPLVVMVVVAWGLRCFETLAFGPGTSPLLSLDPTLFLLTRPTVVTSYAHHSTSTDVADSPLSISLTQSLSLWCSVVVGDGSRLRLRCEPEWRRHRHRRASTLSLSSLRGGSPGRGSTGRQNRPPFFRFLLKEKGASTPLFAFFSFSFSLFFSQANQ